MAETKKKLMRYSGKTLARLIKYVARTSRALSLIHISEPTRPY